MLIPLYLSEVPAGFPSPADDHLDRKLDLNDHLIRHPAATFFVRVQGHSMEEAGIFPDALLIVDRSLTPRNGDVVVAAVHGEVTVKHFYREPHHLVLRAAHPDYPALVLHEEAGTIWGVATYAINPLLRRR